MPEIGECYSIARSIPKELGKIKKVKTSPKYKTHILKGKNSPDKLKGGSVLKVEPYGKSIWFFGETKTKEKFIITSQLGMTGSWFVDNAAKERGHFHFELEFESFDLKYSDPRMFGKMNIYIGQSFEEMTPEIIKKHKWGIDPIQSSVKEINEKLKGLNKSSQEIKSKLLEQNLIFGIGNYLASEILFDAKISPFRKCRELSEKDFLSISTSIKKWVLMAEKSNGFSFAGGYVLPDGSFGNLAQHIKVYQKEGLSCPNNNGIIKKDFIKGRATFYCEKCQK